MTHADEGGPTDIIMTVLCALATISLWIGASYVYIYRDWSPFRVKQIPILIISAVTGGMFIISTPLAENHFNRWQDTFWGMCTLWKFWFQALLGFGPWISCLIIRPFRLYRILVLRKNEKRYGFWIYLAVLWFPWLIYCIAGETISPKFMIYDEDKVICVSGSLAWNFVGFTMIGIYIVIFLVLAFLIRNIRDEYNEYKLIRQGVVVCLSPVIANGVVWAVKEFALDVSVGVKIFGRALSTSAILIGTTYFFWANLAVPIYNHIFNREEYEEQFFKTVRESSDKYVREGVAQTKMERVAYNSDWPTERHEDDEESSAETSEEVSSEEV